MGVFQIILIAGTFLCSLVAGFLFAFAIVAMPGLKNLSDREFIRAFQVIDQVIQDNQPVFMLVWVGSVVTLVIALVLGFGQLAGLDLLLMIVAAAAYLLGVQMPTATINVPLNNRLQRLDVDAMDAVAQQTGRKDFEARWNQSNAIRTAFACLVSILLIVLLFRL